MVNKSNRRKTRKIAKDVLQSIISSQGGESIRKIVFNGNDNNNSNTDNKNNSNHTVTGSTTSNNADNMNNGDFTKTNSDCRGLSHHYHVKVSDNHPFQQKRLDNTDLNNKINDNIEGVDISDFEEENASHSSDNNSKSSDDNKNIFLYYDEDNKENRNNKINNVNEGDQSNNNYSHTKKHNGSNKMEQIQSNNSSDHTPLNNSRLEIYSNIRDNIHNNFQIKKPDDNENVQDLEQIESNNRKELEMLLLDIKKSQEKLHSFLNQNQFR